MQGLLDDILDDIASCKLNIYAEKITILMMCPGNIGFFELSKEQKEKMLGKMTLTERLNFIELLRK